VEVDSGKRPFDISITKNVLALMMSSLLLLVVILCTARWYKKHDVLNEAPDGYRRPDGTPCDDGP
jgi:hypothetical protein